MFEKELPEIDFTARRASFYKKLGDGIALLPAADVQMRNDDVDFPFRQESDFFYLTGFAEPRSFALFSAKSKAKYQIFVQPKDKEREIWDGFRLGPQAAKSELKADAAFASEPESHWEQALLEALPHADKLFYRVGRNFDRDRKIFSLLEKSKRKHWKGGRWLWPIHDPHELLGDTRVVKTRAELSRLQMAATISAEAHVNAIRAAKPGMYEYQVQAVLEHTFKARGATRVGYDSIVASGPNACTLHYVTNNRRIEANDLLLIDAGAEFDYYTADITRTFPVSGTFTREQAEVYDVVLAAQKEAIKMIRPGKKFEEINNTVIEVLTEGLRKLKVLKGPLKTLIAKKAYRPYYPHGASHWLGMDVHDAGRYHLGSELKSRPLAAGMVLTVEPGLYFSPDVASRFRGLGVRIEDDVVVTNKGPTILTSGVPKEREELEALSALG